MTPLLAYSIAVPLIILAAAVVTLWSHWKNLGRGRPY